MTGVGPEEDRRSNICAATGLSTSSVYNTFGSKAQLFDAVLDRYVANSHVLSEPLRADLGVDGLHQWIGRTHKVVTSGSMPRGCLMVMSINELAAEPIDIDTPFMLWRNTLQTSLHNAIGLAELPGQLTPGDTAGRAALLFAANIGLLVAARSDSPTDATAITEGMHATIDSWSA